MPDTPSTTLHTLWVGSELGPLEWVCLSSWTRLGYKVVLHAYENLPAPAGVALFDASRLLAADKVFRSPRNGSLAVFSDIYRVLILKNFAGAWLDADIFLLRPIDFSATNILARERGDGVENINNAVLKLAPDHPILNEILKRFERPYTALPWNKPGKLWQSLVQSAVSGGLHARHLPWGALGYLAIQSHVRKHGFDGRILASALCLTADKAPIFEAAGDPDAALQEPVAYLHMYRSQLACDLARPVPGSVYTRLWEIAEATPPARH